MEALEATEVDCQAAQLQVAARWRRVSEQKLATRDLHPAVALFSEELQCYFGIDAAEWCRYESATVSVSFPVSSLCAYLLVLC